MYFLPRYSLSAGNPAGQGVGNGSRSSPIIYLLGLSWHFACGKVAKAPGGGRVSTW